MKKLLLALALLLSLGGPAWAQAATVNVVITWTKTNAPTIPATSYRIEEKVGTGAFGNLTGATGPTIMLAPTMTFTVTGRAPGTLYTFRVVPIANGVDGTPSASCTAGVLGPNETISVTCSAALQ